MVLILVTMSLSILASISDRSQRPAVRLWIPFALVLPWLVIYVLESVILLGEFPKYYEFVWPLMIVTFFLAAPRVDDVCIFLARISVLTALVSIALGIFGKGSMPYGWHKTDDKAIIGDAALAGPYSHSNILGLAMVLSIPFVLLALRGKERLAGGILVCLALVWSASRISIVAATLVVLILVTVKYARFRRPAQVLTGSWVVAAAAIVIVPLQTTQDSAFTNRGLIWKVTRFYVPDHPVLGWGAGVFQSPDNEFAAAIGSRAVTAHNMWLTVLAVGGWVAVAAVLIALVTVAVRFRFMYSINSIPAFFFLAFLLAEIAEDPLRAWRLSPHAFIVWSGLALAVCTFERKIRPGVSRVDSATRTQQVTEHAPGRRRA
ncbi:O-antigen ligase [Gordonia sp. 'Campus']|uniref:O-antigen ligase family protein n=1 Tax=Gordonia sp. 'Campus' TaxID=2915824 RepID=UPI001EE3C497|nr:O-antigen ligase family protein [Gordonia sp. 'Campus']